VIAPSGIDIGAVLAGKYRVDRVLGQGGMGVVVQAMHLQLHQPVAMKFLLPEVLGSQQVVQRFLREAQAAVRLKSEHVARVIDVGTLETGAPYMVLEYLEGADLSNFPRSQLALGGIIDLMLQACEALAEAHALGIVHRDIKPANFFITRRADGTPLLKVIDFGISKAPTMSSQLTATQAVMGTPAYMSPEQMRSSRDVDHRSDIWSLGIVLYELLQGAPPFGGDTFSSMVLKVVNEPLPRLTVRLPGDLDEIVYRCLEKDPARRFQNTAELAQALARYAQSETQAAISVQRTTGMVGANTGGALERGPGPRALPSTLSGSAGARTTSQSHGRRWSVFAVMGALVAGIAVAIIVASSGSGTEGPSPSARPEGSPKSAPAVGRDPVAAPPPLGPPVAAPPSSTPPPVPTPPPNSAAPPSATAGAATQAGAGVPARDAPAPAESSSTPAAAEPSSRTAAKKPKKPTKSGSPRPGAPATTPPSADEGILDTRK
jgi:serine/threonine-protein kinase